MKIAIYSRKSKFTGKGESIENQIIKCKQFIQFKFDIEPDNAEIFIDEGFSGKNENRPRYQDMIKKVKNKEIDSIIIYQLNRLGRNARDIHNTMQMCEDLGAVIYSATEGFDSSTSFGRAIIGILASLAQLEREQLAERVKDNMYTLAKMGRWLGGQSPLGFNGTREYYIDDTGKERSVTQLKPNNEELKIVKLIYKKYLEEKSISQVSKWTLTNNFKGKNGGNIDKSAIDVILKNPVYVKSDKSVFEYLENNNYEVYGEPNGNGLLRYGQNNNKTDSISITATAKHKGIIDSDDWIQVQEILKLNTEKAPALGKSKSALLTGLLKCSCGSNMQMRYGPKRKDGTRPHYYVCTMKINSGGTRCNSKNLNGTLFEKKLLEYLKIYSKDKLIKELEFTINKSKDLEKSLNINSINEDIESANKSTKILLDNLKKTTEDSIVKIILAEISQLQKTLQDLETKKEKILEDQSEIVLSQYEINSIINNFNDFLNSYDNLTFEKKQKKLNILINKIIYDGNKIHVEFNLKKKLDSILNILSSLFSKYKACQISPARFCMANK
ncbi:MAG: recombinase family protein [Clostridium butyricum]|uniref:recombinase family protein n=1 Tax=Clostridium butyricum TaxID=1492 RepID=UPI0028FE2C94|nr:recombinase family protein [Clostridium butyricum]MDU1339399.1 recombinase family protein [Clostridium butyricum]